MPMRCSPELRLLMQWLSALAGVDAPRAVPDARGVDWNRWLLLVEAQQLSPLLDGAPNGPPRMPGHVAAALRAGYVRNVSRAARQHLELRRIFDDLRELEPVVLKGGALGPPLYPEAARRVMTDLDLLLPDRAAAEAAAAILARRGYQTGRAMPGHHHLPPLFHPANAVMVEVHTNFWTPPLDQDWVRDLWRRRVPGGAAGGWVLDPAAQLLHHGLHALSDPLNAPLLRNLFEVAWLAARLAPPDQARLDGLAREGGVPVVAARALGLASAWLGAPGLLPVPPPGAFEWWARRRLEWAAPVSRWEHMVRQLAIEHVDRLVLGADPRSWRVVAGVLTQAVGRAWRARRPARAADGCRWRPGPELRAAELDGVRMLHQLRTDDVHLLNPPAARVIDWLQVPQTGTELTMRLQAAGYSARTARATLQQLRAGGLILPAGE